MGIRRPHIHGLRKQDKKRHSHQLQSRTIQVLTIKNCHAMLLFNIFVLLPLTAAMAALAIKEVYDFIKYSQQ